MNKVIYDVFWRYVKELSKAEDYMTIALLTIRLQQYIEYQKKCSWKDSVETKKQAEELLQTLCRSDSYYPC